MSKQADQKPCQMCKNRGFILSVIVASRLGAPDPGTVWIAPCDDCKQLTTYQDAGRAAQRYLNRLLDLVDANEPTRLPDGHETAA